MVRRQFDSAGKGNMNYSQYITELDTLALDVHLSQGAFCRSIGRTSAWWSQVKNGKRTLYTEDEIWRLINKSLGITVHIENNSVLDYEIVQDGDIKDYFTDISGRTCNRGNYAGLWSEFMLLNGLESAELDLDAIREYLDLQKADGVRIQASEDDLELFKRAFYRYLREFNGMLISEINGNRFPVSVLKQYDDWVSINWGLLGSDCGKTSESVPF